MTANTNANQIGNINHNNTQETQSILSGNYDKSPSHHMPNYIEDFSCCYELHKATLAAQIAAEKEKRNSKIFGAIVTIYKIVSKVFSFIRKYVRKLCDHRYFQQGILLAILINTLSMGIEYHNQPEELTAIVETSNIVFSAIFAVEMVLKVVAEGPFKYVSNGFNVFDGVIVILRWVEIKFINKKHQQIFLLYYLIIPKY